METTPSPETKSSGNHSSRFDALVFVTECLTGGCFGLLEEQGTSSEPSPPPLSSAPSSDFNHVNQSPPPKKSRRKTTVPVRAPINPVPLPELTVPDLNLSVPIAYMDAMNRLGITDGPVLVIEKTLTSTDVKSNQNRISFPEKQVNEEFIKFLTDEEKEILEGNDKKNDQIIVQLIEPDDRNDKKRVSDGVVFKKWKMRKESGNTSYIYLFNGLVWKRVRDENKLEEGEKVEVWAFRDVNFRLSFALIRV